MRGRPSIFCLASILIFVAPTAQAEVVGTWKQNLAKSKFDPGPMPKNPQNVKWEAAGSGYKVTIDAVNAQGVTGHTEYTVAAFCGKDYPVTSTNPNLGYDSISYKRVDPSTIIMLYKRAGAVNRITRMIESPDGKSLSLDQLGYGPQGASNNTIVFEKQ